MSIYSLAECGHSVEVGAQCQTCWHKDNQTLTLDPGRRAELRDWFLQHKRANPLAQELLGYVDALTEQASQLTEERDLLCKRDVLAHMYVFLAKQNDRLAERVKLLRDALKTKCMCFEKDDPRASRGPCHACRVLAKDDKLSKVD